MAVAQHTSEGNNLCFTFSMVIVLERYWKVERNNNNREPENLFLVVHTRIVDNDHTEVYAS
jgi:hypothetical protein